MEKRKTSVRFWAVLGLVNVLAIAYPMSQFLCADGDGASLWSALLLIIVVFLLLITDAVGILVARWS